jgi:arylsulfatase A-like enzyme
MKAPLIIKYPKGEFAGTSNNKLVSNIDIAPTVINAAGLEIPESMTGHDLTEASISREYVFAHNWLGAQAMARSKNYKLIQNRKGKSLFFDLKNDPLEMNNLYDDATYQDKIKAHYEAIDEWQGMDSVFGENYLDYNAPIINQPNVTTRDDGHREGIIEYYKQKMSEQ